ncbi:MAG TPA: acyl carrier protein [Terriglobia bacterium]|nr:acyl carrier protein [Terriglobia bacterium]
MVTLTDIIRQVFEDDSLVARDDMTAADVEKWDSLSHIDLIVTIERTFRVKLTTREVTSLKNIGEVADLIQKKLGVPVERQVMEKRS